MRGGDGDREHAGGRGPGDHEPEPIAHPGGERVAACELHERAVGGVDAGEPGLLRAERDDFGRAAEQLHQLGRELTSGAGLAAAAPAAHQARQRRHAEAAGEQPGGEHESGGGSHRRRGADRDRAGQQRDKRRPEAAQVQILDRIHVRDHPCDQVALAVGVELGGRQRFDPLEEAHSDAPEYAEREVVGAQPLEVAEDRPPEAEELDRDDRDHQRQDGGTLGGPRDQVAGRRHQADAEHDRQRPEHGRERQPTARRVRELEQRSQGRAHAALVASPEAAAPSLRRTTRSQL